MMELHAMMQAPEPSVIANSRLIASSATAGTPAVYKMRLFCSRDRGSWAYVGEHYPLEHDVVARSQRGVSEEQPARSSIISIAGIRTRVERPKLVDRGSQSEFRDSTSQKCLEA